MTTVASTDVAPSHRWVRVGLVLIAALELLDALSSVQGIFTDFHHETALLRFAQGLTSIKLALSPLLAGGGPSFRPVRQYPLRGSRIGRPDTYSLGAG